MDIQYHVDVIKTPWSEKNVFSVTILTWSVPNNTRNLAASSWMSREKKNPVDVLFKENTMHNNSGLQTGHTITQNWQGCQFNDSICGPLNIWITTKRTDISRDLICLQRSRARAMAASSTHSGLNALPFQLLFSYVIARWMCCRSLNQYWNGFCSTLTSQSNFREQFFTLCFSDSIAVINPTNIAQTSKSRCHVFCSEGLS